MFPKTPEKPELERVIDETIEDIRRQPLDSEEYKVAVDTLVKLYSLKENPSDRRVSPDTMATVAANLLGIAIIVGYERMNIMTSKAINFITRLK